MKILVAGEGHSPIHEVAVANSFKKMNLNVEIFYWHNYFYSKNFLKRFLKKIENKYLIGPSITKLNKNFFKKVRYFTPDLIFIYRGTHILPKTLIKIKEEFKFIKIFGYNNDNPFSEQSPSYLWRHYLKCVQIYDVNYAYRHSNLTQLKNYGARDVDLLRSWFIPEANFKITLNPEDKLKYNCDVVFAGHFENDGRLEYLEYIVEAGYKLKIFGPSKEWNKVILKSKRLKYLYPISQVWSLEYNKAISGSKIALCFLSKLNKDTYTRRCFEIPSIGTMLLSEYSEDLASLYIQKKEAEYFTSKYDLLKKIDYYLKESEIRNEIALNGYKKVFLNGHDIHSRMSKVIDKFISLNEKK